MSQELVTIDVCADIRGGLEPFSRIMRQVSELAAGQGLRVVAPFEPLPLLQVMARKGFSCQSAQTGAGEWEVLFTPLPETPRGDAPVTMADTQMPAMASSASLMEVDARGLEPPQPLVTILEALSTLPVGAILCAKTDRRPIHLYAQLEERGFVGRSEERFDGSFLTYIRTR